MTITTILIIAFVFVGVACFIAGYQAGKIATYNSVMDTVEQLVGRRL